MKEIKKIIKDETNFNLEIINQEYVESLGLARIVLRAPQDIIYIYFKDDGIVSAHFHETTMYTIDEILACINFYTKG